MLTTISSRFVSAGILLLFLISAGIYLHRTGKPYQPLVIGIHKIFTVAMIVLVTMVAVQTLKSTGTMVTQMILAGTLIISLAGLLITGALMSLDRFQAVMLAIHRVLTLVFIAGFSCLGYLVYKIVE